jgi:hypothetical protein
MYIEQLKYFVDIIDCKSISGAAKKLFITQSALSQSISNLENELGAKLLVRSNQGILATAFGRVVYDDSTDIIRIVDKYKAKWDAMVYDGSLLSAEVRIVVFPSAGNILVDRIIPEMSDAYPNIIVTLYEEIPATGKSEIQAMEKYAATMCLWSCADSEIASHLKEIEYRGYLADVLCTDDPLHLLLSSKNPLSKKDFIYDHQLAELPIAFYSDEPIPKYVKYFDKNKYFKLQQRGIIMRFIANNNAAAVFPKKVSETEPYLRSKQIVSIPIISEDKEAFPQICRYLIRRHDDELTEAEERVISVIKYYFK